ncbi:SDR family NAD(P)-dependent oxidoreductase [Micromonospora tarensis]|uniref:SDR family NAD(P)-dependent oxidoreductase n=1 Tax=Micromonospora tarensis TaxID=2806100 RepID=UPI0021044048|nr:SDR family NAD(P)-dependent oxidoreductase [Micromonospora tarensis]
MSTSYVVTGGGRGVGRAVVERLVATGATVVVLERDADAVDWLAGHRAADRLVAVVGDAADEQVAEHAAELAERAAPLTGWVNNAAVFRDAALHSASADTVLDLIGMNLRPAVVGAGVAVRRFLARAAGARSSTSRRTRPADRCPVPCRTRQRRPPWRV